MTLNSCVFGRPLRSFTIPPALWRALAGPRAATTCRNNRGSDPADSPVNLIRMNRLGKRLVERSWICSRNCKLQVPQGSISWFSMSLKTKIHRRGDPCLSRRFSWPVNCLCFKQLRPSRCGAWNGLELGGSRQLHFYLHLEKAECIRLATVESGRNARQFPIR